MIDEAIKKKAVLITTEKDHVRIPKSLQRQVKTLPITIKWENMKTLESLLKRIS